MWAATAWDDADWEAARARGSNRRHLDLFFPGYHISPAALVRHIVSAA
jgi:hypothetical protein